jgi:hypothetical protein
METKTEVKRLVYYADSQLGMNAAKLDTIAGVEVTLVSGRVGSGKFGEFAEFDILDELGEVKTFRTSGFLVVEAIKKAVEANAFPLLCVFTRTGKCWRME